MSTALLGLAAPGALAVQPPAEQLLPVAQKELDSRDRGLLAEAE